jgi:hypothetical protein
MLMKSAEKAMSVVSRTFLAEASFTTYPHMNAYVDGGQAFVYKRTDQGVPRLYRRELASGRDTCLTELRARTGGCWEVAWRNSSRLAVVDDNRAWIIDLSRPDRLREVYAPTGGAKVDALCSISGDGQKLLLREHDNGQNRALEVDLASGTVRHLFTQDWYANHFHYCPYDASWVAFSHEGPAEEIPDRCWVWHADHAPKGRVAFDQASEQDGVLLCAGHERWCFHDVSGYVVAYAVSPAGKRGLYEIYGDGRPAQLRWHSDVLWHCTMDTSGRFVAADTTGPFREEPFSDADYRRYTDRWRKYDSIKRPRVVDVVVLDLERQQSIHLAEAWSATHPYHPHPAISPDGRWVAWNDWDPERRGIWLAELAMD